MVTDRQDSVLLLTNSTQGEAAEYGYLPYGNTYKNTDGGTIGNPYRYIGAFLDTTTGNYKMWAGYCGQPIS
ncbi:hypothetical protein [Micromonospora sp.]|uniref:hypothetical protein n=1 Tax=Micromonospora sp. TaxID=1876 RepID=UPI003B3BBB3E